MKRITRSKKAVTHTWFDYVISIVGGTIIFIIIFFVMNTGTARVEREIKAQTADIMSEEILISYLSSNVRSDDPFKDLFEKDEYKLVKELVESKITFAKLIVFIGEGEGDKYRGVLKKETEQIFNTTIGKEKWKFEVIYPDLEGITIGGFKGETNIYETMLPTSGYYLTSVKLTVKKENGK
ncbi:hypothetical protein ACFL6I_15110 [candidate division KSB1 bacterium]